MQEVQVMSIKILDEHTFPVAYPEEELSYRPKVMCIR
jgi:hypothetical protein